MSNFELSAKLRLFLSLAADRGSVKVGVKCPVSVRKRYRFAQTIVIYPEAEYNFFTWREVQGCFSVVDVLGLDCCVSVENGLPVLEISDYSINSK